MTADPQPDPSKAGIPRQLKPFGGVYGQQAWEQAKDKAIRTRSRQYCFDHGFITAKDLDDEELVAGRCRNENGVIPKKSGKTELIPRELYDEMVAEHELRYKQKLRQNLDRMLDVMVGIADDDTVEPRDRFEAAKYIFERTAGKTPDTVTVSIKRAPWEDLLSQVAGIAPMNRDDHRRLGVGIVDAEVVEDGEEEAQEEEAHGAQRREDFDPYVHRPTGATADPPTAMSTERTTGDGAVAEEPYQDEPELNYGRRADEKRSYAQQAQDAQSLARRRKEAKQKIQNATKQRKIARAVGADAIKDEITGVDLGEDGKIRFEQR
jgi:hypothetical protein